MTPRNTPDYTSRDKAVLAYIGLFRVSIQAFISQLFFDGKQCGHILRKFADDEGLVQINHRAISGGISPVQLTYAGCKRVGVPKDRAATVRSTALDMALATGWSCCFGKTRRLDNSDTEYLFPKGGPPRNVPHLYTEEFGEPCVLRAYHALAGIEKVKQQVVKLESAAYENEHLGPRIVAGDYGLLVLAPTEEKVKQIKAAIPHGNDSGDVRVVVSLGPTAQTIASYLRKRRGE